MNLQNWILGIIIALLCGCAQIRSVEGGPKDNQPPKLIRESTPNQAIHWRESELSFEFDEYIQLEDVQNQIIISPEIKPFPLIKIKGKSVLISWEQPLAENTTYTFQFGEAIVDITENNPTTLERVYSTGSFLDSLQLAFNVKNAWERASLDHGTLLLLKQPFHPDSTLKIAYQKKVENDTTVFRYLPSASFYVVAFNDNNKDGQWTSGEWIQWMDEPVQSQWKCDTIRLAVAPLHQNLTSLIDAQVDSIGVAKWYWPESYLPTITHADNFKGVQWKDHDTLYYALKGTPDDGSHTIKIQWNNGEQDSLAIPFFMTAIENFKWKNHLSTPLLIGEKINIPIHFLLDSLDTDRLRWSLDNKKSTGKILLENHTIQIIPGEKKKGDFALTLLPQSCFSNGVAWPNDTIDFKYKIQTPEEWGSIQWKFIPQPTTGYFSLENEKGIKVEFPIAEWPKTMNLPAGKYQLRWIEDTDQNLHWTAGDFNVQRHAEQVSKFPELIQVRANWTQEVRWDLK